MNVTIRADHGSNVLGVSDHLHFTELLTIFRYPMQRFTSFTAILNPTAFSIVQVEASNMVHGTERRCQRGHQAPKGRGCHSEVVSVSTLGWLQEIQAVRVPWDDCFLEPSEDRVEGHCKEKTARWTALPYTSGHKEMSPSCCREFHVSSAVVINTAQEAADKIRRRGSRSD